MLKQLYLDITVPVFFALVFLHLIFLLFHLKIRGLLLPGAVHVDIMLLLVGAQAAPIRIHGCRPLYIWQNRILLSLLRCFGFILRRKLLNIENVSVHFFPEV